MHTYSGGSYSVQYISSDQNALDRNFFLLSAGMAEKFDNNKLFASNMLADLMVV